ncbi:MAG: hypothetical protein K6D95_02555 [Treponema sp.]|jgi:hypothetical protein|nr:hypothetical protein [Treponema sp.]
MFTLSIILIIAGIILSASAEDDYQNQVREEKRHRELMAKLDEVYDYDEEDFRPSRKRIIRRRITKDKDGNTLAEEIIEEEI